MSYEWQPGMRLITSMEGDCELACRKMLATAIEWMDGHPTADLRYGPSGFPESADARELHNAVFDASPEFFGVVGGLATSHARFVRVNGWDAYVAVMQEKR